MKKTTLLIILATLCAIGQAHPTNDTVPQPVKVVGKRFNEAGNVAAQYTMDFSYNQDGTLDRLSFPGREVTLYHYYGDSVYWEDTWNYKFVYPQEDYVWYYNDMGKLDRAKHEWPDQYYSSEYYTYFYDEWGRLVRRNTGLSWENIASHTIKEYSQDGCTVTETSYQGNGNVPTKRQTFLYDDIHTLLSKQVDQFTSGEITSSVLYTYSYAPNGKVEAEVRQNLNEGQWVNASIVQYAYDDSDRVTEIDKGTWSQEDQVWITTRKRVFDYQDGEMKMTVSFLKLVDGEWVWDIYTDSETIFFDPPMTTVHQRAMRFLGSSFYYNSAYSPFEPVNQLEVTYEFTSSPVYMEAGQTPQADVAVYPNPGKGEVRVKAPMERAVVRFYDQQGRLVVSTPFDFATTVSTDGWASGVYVWEVWHDTRKEASGKWIKK